MCVWIIERWLKVPLQLIQEAANWRNSDHPELSRTQWIWINVSSGWTVALNFSTLRIPQWATWFMQKEIQFESLLTQSCRLVAKWVRCIDGALYWRWATAKRSADPDCRIRVLMCTRSLRVVSLSPHLTTATSSTATMDYWSKLARFIELLPELAINQHQILI